MDRKAKRPTRALPPTGPLRLHGAPSSTARLLGVLFVLVLLSLPGCSCNEDPTNGPEPTEGCTTDTECIEEHGDRWFCRDSECVMGPRYCEEEGDVACCPGQTCSRHGVCLDRYDECTDDEDCRIAGQLCMPRLINGAEQDVCTFALCDDGECPDDLFCFAGFCIGENPCGGGCPAGEACVPSNNTCHPAPMCEETCPEGSILTFGDPENVDDDCDMDSLFCICEALPPLAVRDTGRHSDLALLPDGGLALSAYNGDFGDLVVAYFDSSGDLTDIDWVDGIPENAPAVANPAGPRKGIDDPGPNVGRYSSIAVASDGALHVSYFDVTEERLKYARRTAAGWITHVVDEEGDVGRYSSIALNTVGAPTIAYFQRRGVDEDRMVTALKVASASGMAPSEASDWSIVVSDSAPVTSTPCDGGCPDGEHCVRDGSETACHQTVSGCDGCSSGQVCVDLGSGPTCKERLGTASLADLPDGTGLFPSVEMAPDGTAAIAYYDKLDGALKLASGVDARSDESGTIHVLDASCEDVGRFPSAKIDDSGNMVVAYQDAAFGQARWLRSSLSGNVHSSGVLDDGGRGPGTVHLVGMDNALVITDDDRRLVAYQDSTAGELVLATEAGDSWQIESIFSEGAAGFHANAVVHGRTLYLSHSVIRGEPNRPVTTTLRVEVVNL